MSRELPPPSSKATSDPSAAREMLHAQRPLEKHNAGDGFRRSQDSPPIRLPPLQIPDSHEQEASGPRLPAFEPWPVTGPRSTAGLFHDHEPLASGSGRPRFPSPTTTPYGSAFQESLTAISPRRVFPSRSRESSSQTCSTQARTSAISTSPPILQAENRSERFPSSDTPPQSLSSVTSRHAESSGSTSWTEFGQRLRIRQQPKAARACGFGERDRRVIDPPPILDLEGLDARFDEDEAVSLNSMAVVHASLWDEAGSADVTYAQPTNRRPGGRLMGTLVASSVVAKDETANEGVFFAFPDLSCRTYGRYRLRFSLVKIDPIGAQLGAVAPVLATVMSEVFTVYSASEFPGMRPSTPLTRALRDQGSAIPVKKGKRYGPLDGEQNANDDDSDDEGDAQKRKRR